MIQSRDGPRLALETSAVLRAQNLDGHGAAEARIASLVDLTHATGSERRLKKVRPESLAGSERGGFRGRKQLPRGAVEDFTFLPEKHFDARL